ncbi:MAG: histidinol-phosphatase HisJ family protein [Oscillospiraceae bacterium]|nr:histidinol-phosphatase HisJ family protein [Oscillospiraceae bacterium]
MLFDFHLHSNVSSDSDEPMEHIVRTAIAKGFSGICFADHCDLISYEAPGVRLADCYELWEPSYGEIARIRAEFGDEIEILHGMELAEIAQDEERARQYANPPGLDFLLGSVHAVTGHSDFAFIHFADILDISGLMAAYLDENIRMAEINVMDAVGHVGYPSRYLARQGFPTFDLMEYEDQLRHLFEILIQNGRGIEVNTSGLRQGLGFPYPSFPALKLYRELGGEIITVGSDAHRAVDTGGCVREGYDLLREAGFRYTTVFRQRKPAFIKL